MKIVAEGTRERASRRGEAGFTLIEAILAATIGLIVLTSGFFLYKSQTSMSLKQEDTNTSLMTIDYVVDMVRTMVISAGGGLPQMVNGLRSQGDGTGLVAYFNPNDLYTAVTSANTDTTDGVIPVAQASIFDSAGYVLLTNGDAFALSAISSLDTAAKTLTVPAAVETALGKADFAYPVVYDSLYVDGSRYLRQTQVNQGTDNANVPLAFDIDSLNLSYDVSANGDGTFSDSINDSSKVSRVKVFIRVKAEHTAAGSATRQYETIVGIRRGRLYNRGV